MKIEECISQKLKIDFDKRPDLETFVFSNLQDMCRKVNIKYLSKKDDGDYNFWYKQEVDDLPEDERTFLDDFLTMMDTLRDKHWD